MVLDKTFIEWNHRMQLRRVVPVPTPSIAQTLLAQFHSEIATPKQMYYENHLLCHLGTWIIARLIFLFSTVPTVLFPAVSNPWSMGSENELSSQLIHSVTGKQMWPLVFDHTAQFVRFIRITVLTNYKPVRDRRFVKKTSQSVRSSLEMVILGTVMEYQE